MGEVKMIGEQKLFDVAAEICRVGYKSRLEELLSESRKIPGYFVSFSGEYTQKTVNPKSKIMVVPYIVLQDADQLTDMPDGIFSGIILETFSFANINGSISPERVEFIKRYDHSGLSKNKRKRYGQIRDLLLPDHKGKPLFNENLIHYEGQWNNSLYEGSWEFDSKYKARGIESTVGTFNMRKEP